MTLKLNLKLDGANMTNKRKRKQKYTQNGLVYFLHYYTSQILMLNIAFATLE